MVIEDLGSGKRITIILLQDNLKLKNVSRDLLIQNSSSRIDQIDQSYVQMSLYISKLSPNCLFRYLFSTYCHGRKTHFILLVGLILTPAAADWHHLLWLFFCAEGSVSVDSPVGRWRLRLDRLLQCENIQLSLPFLLWNLLEWRDVCLVPRAV